MRNVADLRSAFDSVETGAVDPDQLLARVHSGSTSLQAARRRGAAVLSVAAAAVLITIGAVLIATLAGDPAEGGQVASTPPAEPAPAAQTLLPTEIAFSVGQLPPGYASIYAVSYPGAQFLEIGADEGMTASPSTIRVELFDPAVSGLPAPTPSVETIAIPSVTEGELVMQVTHDGPSVFTDGLWLRLSVQTDTGLTFNVIADWSGAEIPQVVLDVAAQVDLGNPQPFMFPYQLGYVPTGLEPFGTVGDIGADGILQGGLLLSEGAPTPDSGPAVTFAFRTVASNPDYATYVTPNTTIGPYEAELTSTDGRTILNVFNVDGFVITLEIPADYQGLVDEAELRRIAESIVVIPGAAADVSVWSDQPLV